MEGLTEDESLALLERLVGAPRLRAEPTEARGLVRRTAGLPQVLRAVGTRLASRPEWTLASAGERMHPQTPEESLPRPECGAIESPYESALRDLTPAQTRAFRLLAIPDGPTVTVRAAAAVLAVPVAEAENLLESLADAHLIEPGAGDSYRYLPPVRAFARGQALRLAGRAELAAVTG